MGEYLKGATEAGATLAKEAVLIDDSNKVKERINILFILFCVKDLNDLFWDSLLNLTLLSKVIYGKFP